MSHTDPAEAWFVWSQHGAPAVIGIAAYVGAQILTELIGGFHSKRGSRDAVRDLLASRIETTVFEVRDLACEHWSEAGNVADAPKRAASIVGRNLFIGELVVELFAANSEMSRFAQTTLNTFDEACTGQGFDHPLRKPSPERSREIEVAAYTLVHTVGRLRRQM